MDFENDNKEALNQKESNSNNLQVNNCSDSRFFAEPIGQTKASSINLKSLCQQLLGNLKYQVFITILTLYSLFSDDFRTTFFAATVDPIFHGFSLAVMAIFFIEIILSTLVIDGYFLSFFFFLDIISTISIILDVNFITAMIFQTSSTSSVAQLASQSKASRAATRAVRIVKLFRIIRIIKLYKNSQKVKQIKEQSKKKQALKQKFQQRKNKNHPPVKELVQSGVQHSQNLMVNDVAKMDVKQVHPQEQLQHIESLQVGNEPNQVAFNEDQISNATKKESKIGKILSQLSLKKIIIVVLLMMFIIPLFSIDLYRDPEDAWDYLLYHQQQLLMVNPANVSSASIIGLITSQMNDFGNVDNYIIQYTSPFNELPYLNSIDLSTLRNADLLSSVQTINTSLVLSNRPDLTLRQANGTISLTSLNAILNQNSYNRTIAAFSIGKTLFTCLILLLLMHLFSKNIDTLLVEPIQGMIEKLMIMAKDPESAAKEDLNTNIELQTTIISNAIIKIGALLSTVFGSAGAQIIGSNIIAQGDMNPMIQGKKKCAIFGFCDIRNFTEVTQILQEQILIFVNKIGSLVHQSVYRYGGSANKNIGQAFLLVWKIPQQKYALDHTTNKIDWLDRRYLNVLADFSLLGFVKTLIKIHKDPIILQYGLDPRLRAALGDYKVRMGFGLHIGWAIEGAIGSQYKIDASYLSPNVNMASRLQAATKQFGVDFLLSQDLYELLTSQMKAFCRNIDRVTVKGSEKPLKLYTVDLCYERLSPSVPKQLKYPNPADIPDSQSKRTLNMEYLRQQQLQNYSASRFIMGKKQLRQAMVDSIPQVFRKRFQLGVSCYLKGKWADSRLHLCQALKFRNQDGPTKTLLGYMKKHNFSAPSDWKQFRPLTSK